MTDVQVLSAPANRPVVLPALEVLAEIPIVVLHRVIRGHAHIEIVKGKAIVCSRRHRVGGLDREDPALPRDPSRLLDLSARQGPGERITQGPAQP